VQPHVTDIHALKPVEMGIALLAALHQLHGNRLTFDITHFDRLAGSAHVRQMIEAGAPHDEIVAPWQAYEQQFWDRAQPWLLYS
jgi:uncharacterized protein YbbC (DUF1343 family)